MEPTQRKSTDLDRLASVPHARTAYANLTHGLPRASEIHAAQGRPQRAVEMALNTALQNRHGRWLVYLYPHDVAERAERLLQIGQPVAAAQLKALGASRLLDAQGRSDFLPGHPVRALLLPSPLFPGLPNDHPQDASLPKHVEPGDSMI